MSVSKLKLEIARNNVILYGTQYKVYNKLYDVIKRLTKVPMGSNLRVHRFDMEIAHMETYYLIKQPNDVVEIAYVNLLSRKITILASATVSSFKNWGRPVDKTALNFLKALQQVRSMLTILDFTAANVTDCELCYIRNCTWTNDAFGVVTVTYLHDDLLDVKRCSLQTAWREVTAESKNPQYRLVACNHTGNILFYV